MIAPRLLAAALVSVAIAGCASLRVERLQAAAQSAHPEEGLAALERFARQNPGSARAVATYETQRALIVGTFVNEAELARLWGNPDDARELYLRALSFDPGNAIARKGLDLLDRDRRLADQTALADQLARAGDRVGAESRARAVLGENPSHREARRLLRSLADAQATEESAPQQLGVAAQRPVTLEFRDASLRAVFDVLAQTTGINFTFDREVRSDLKTTIFVKDANLDDVIRLLLATNQLERKVIGESSMVIFPNNAGKLKDYQDLVLRTFYLTNADAKQVAQLVRTVAKTRDVHIDEKLNLLVVRDTPQAMKLIEQLIAGQDLGEPEVVLEVEVLEVSRSTLDRLGLDPAPALQYGVGLGTTGAVAGATAALVPLTGGGFRWYVPNPAAILNLRGTLASTNVLANPRIRVRNRDKAKIHIGERVPVITTTSTANVGVSSSVSYLDTGLKLDVEPNVYLDDEVAIKVQLEVSNIIERLNINNTIAYRLGTRNTATTLRLRDGETQMLAGLLQDTATRSVNGLPYVSSVPLLNRLFSNEETVSKSEIILLITPRVVRNLARPDAVPAQVYSGTDASFGGGPMKLRSAPAGAASANGTMSLARGAGSALPPGTTASPAAPVRPSGGSAGATATRSSDSSILWVAPANVAPGEEFLMSIALPREARASSVAIDVIYDAALLEVLGGVEVGAEGRARVEAVSAGAVEAPVATVRLRARPGSRGITQLVVERVRATDASGAPLVLEPPPARLLGIAPSAP